MSNREFYTDQTILTDAEIETLSKEPPQPEAKPITSTKDWNARFQELTSLLEAEDETTTGTAAGVTRLQTMADLAKDFAHAAATYGRIIISELFLPTTERTIKPLPAGISNLGSSGDQTTAMAAAAATTTTATTTTEASIGGGIAGGEKFVVKGIFFKLAVDRFGIYRSDEFAAKVAGHELKALQSIRNCLSGTERGGGGGGGGFLKLPLFALIDYRGFRLSAVSLLPINRGTIVYGSSDAAKTIHCDPQSEVARAMEATAKKLNLKGHEVSPGKVVHSPVDVEVHLGLDGCHYVVDSSRLFPPEAPSWSSSSSPSSSSSSPSSEGMPGTSYLWRLLRPEFVKTNPQPLSSDAFSPFDRDDPMREVSRREVRDATERLHGEVIPAFAAQLDAIANSRTPPELWRLTQNVHRNGINVRHMLEVHGHCKSELARTVLLTEAVSRAAKCHLRELMRDAMRRSPLEETPFVRIAVSVLNSITSNGVKGGGGGDDDRAGSWWDEILPPRLARMFPTPKATTDIARSCPRSPGIEGQPLRALVDVALLVKRFLQMTGIEVTETALAEFQRSAGTFRFLDPDVVRLSERVKQLNVVYLSEGLALLSKASVLKPEQAKRLWAVAESQFEKAVDSSTDSASALVQWGTTLFERSRKITGKMAVRLLKQSIDKLSSAEEINSQNANLHSVWGRVLAHLGFLKQQQQQQTSEAQAELFEMAASRMLRAAELEPKAIEPIIADAANRGKRDLVSFVRAAMANPKLLELATRVLAAGRPITPECNLSNSGPIERRFLVTTVTLFRPRSLVLRGCSGVTDEVVSSIGEADGVSGELRSLNVAGTGVSGEAVASLAAQCPKLRSLVIGPTQARIIDKVVGGGGGSSTGIAVEIETPRDDDGSGRTQSPAIPVRPVIFYVTKNTAKTEEVEQIMTGWRIKQRVLHLSGQAAAAADVDHPERQSEEQARKAFEVIRGPLLVDSAFIEVEGIGMIAGTEFAGIGAFEFSRRHQGRSCSAVVFVAFTADGETVHVRDGRLRGTIVHPPRAVERGFGWDPILVPEGMTCTLSEMADHKAILNFRHTAILRMVYEVLNVHFRHLMCTTRRTSSVQLLPSST